MYAPNLNSSRLSVESTICDIVNDPMVISAFSSFDIANLQLNEIIEKIFRDEYIGSRLKPHSA